MRELNCCIALFSRDGRKRGAFWKTMTKIVKLIATGSPGQINVLSVQPVRSRPKPYHSRSSHHPRSNSGDHPHYGSVQRARRLELQNPPHRIPQRSPSSVGQSAARHLCSVQLSIRGSGFKKMFTGELDGEARIVRERGRPGFLPLHSEAMSRAQIRSRTLLRDWTIVREVIERIVAEPERTIAIVSGLNRPIEKYLLDYLPMTLMSEMPMHLQKLDAAFVTRLRRDISKSLVRLALAAFRAASRTVRAKSRKVIVMVGFHNQITAEN
jgi:hypothetical protein